MAGKASCSAERTAVAPPAKETPLPSPSPLKDADLVSRGEMCGGRER